MIHPLSPNTKYRGFNLIEAAIVLGVVGLVIGGIWVAAASVQENRRQTRFLEQILEITQNIRRGFAGVSFSITTYNFVDVAAPGYMPKDSWGSYIPLDMIGNSIFPLTPWGSDIEISVTQDTIYFGSHLTATNLTSFPISTCAALGPRIYAAIKNQVPSGTPVNQIVRTLNTYGDISTPTLAAENCQSEWDTEGMLGISFGVRR